MLVSDREVNNFQKSLFKVLMITRVGFGKELFAEWMCKNVNGVKKLLIQLSSPTQMKMKIWAKLFEE